VRPELPGSSSRSVAQVDWKREDQPGHRTLKYTPYRIVTIAIVVRPWLRRRNVHSGACEVTGARERDSCCGPERECYGRDSRRYDGVEVRKVVADIERSSLRLPSVDGILMANALRDGWTGMPYDEKLNRARATHRRDTLVRKTANRTCLQNRIVDFDIKLRRPGLEGRRQKSGAAASSPMSHRVDEVVV
jgi:hypothetical protein